MRTTRRWTGTTARVDGTGPARVEPSEAVEEAGGTTGKKRTEKWLLPSVHQWLHSTRRLPGMRTGRRVAVVGRKRPLHRNNEPHSPGA